MDELEIKRTPGRPNIYESGRMVMRSFRFPEELATAASKKAESENKSLSVVIREMLEKYIQK